MIGKQTVEDLQQQIEFEKRADAVKHKRRQRVVHDIKDALCRNRNASCERVK